MENVVKNFFGYLKLNDEEDDEFDDYMDDDLEEERENRRPTAVRNRYTEDRDQDERKISRTENRYARKSEEESSYKDRNSRMQKTTNEKVVPISSKTSDLEVCIMKPTSFDNSQDVCDTLLTGRACVVNLEGFDAENAQRIMDFISGCVYAINGKLHQISRYIFIFSPENVDISADDMDLIPDLDFGVPTINKEF